MSRTYEQLEPVISALDERIKTNLGAFPTDTAEGSIASFPDGADDIPLKSLVVNIDPVQSGSGDPSPDNVRPISGWTGANVVACGKNLLDPSLLKDQVAWNFIPVYAPAGTVLTMSTNQPVNTSGLLTYFMIPGGTQGSAENVYAGHPVTQTVGEDGYLNVAQRNRDSITSYADYEYQIEAGSTVTDYEPYTGQTIPIDWQTEAGTVYGGHLDVLSGVLTVDRAMVDLGTLNWAKNVGDWQTFFSNDINNTVKKPSKVGDTNVVCSVYKTEISSISSAGDNYVYIIQGQVRIKDTAKKNLTAADFKITMNGVQLVYELATPITIQLTPHDVKSLLGTNNVWADTGDSAVEYRADTKMYIERLTEPDADMIADANITSGSYFMVGNSLYLATSNIASGEQVIVGTNCTQKSLATALNEINQ